MESWTIKRLLDWTTDYFKKYNIEWPHLEAEILLAHALKFKRIELYTKHEQILTPEELGKFKGFIQRRSQHEPIAYITNNQPFMSLDFYVDRSALIPRPETEKLVEVVIDFIKTLPVTHSPLLITDLGTGSGCIAVSLAKYLPNIKVIGIDSSPEAIKIAQKNAEAHNVLDRCEFVVGDMFQSLLTFMTQKPEEINLIVSNPPYIPTADIDTLETDVKGWEPGGALDGGPDGLDYIKKLIEQATCPLIFEFGINQAEKIKELAKTKFKEIKILRDNSGTERIFVGI